MTRNIIILFLFISSSLFANYQATYSVENIKKDFQSGTTEKYIADTFITLTDDELVRQGIINRGTVLSSDRDSVDCAEFLAPNGNYTATVYKIDAANGRVSCMVGNIGDQYNPIGLFDVYYPKIEELYKKNYNASKAQNATAIERSNQQFKVLTDEKKRISTEVTTTGTGYLNVVQLLLSSILTDISVIDLEATQATNKLQLKNGFTAKIYSTNAGVTDNSELLKSQASSIFAVYQGMSSVSMPYFLYLVIFSLVIGGGGVLFKAASDKVDNTNDMARKTPYVLGILAGVLLFFPVSDYDRVNNASGQEAAQYDIMKTRYQTIEKTGYYMFSDWANSLAKVAIDAEFNSLIQNASLGNEQNIIDTHAGMVQYTNLRNQAETISRLCSSTYKSQWLVADNKNIYSDNPNTKFPTSENWAYAASWAVIGGYDYYNSEGGGIVQPTGYSEATTRQANGRNLNDFYPQISMSACGNNDLMAVRYAEKQADYTKAYNAAIFDGGQQEAGKMQVLRGLTNFEYEFYRDFGFLAVIGLPIVTMQTEYIGALYRPENNWIKKANEEIGGNWVGEKLHDFLSSIPYLMIPGSMSIYTAAEENAGKIGAAIGAATGSGGGLIGSALGGLIGGAAAKVGSNTVGFSLAVIYAKSLIILAPILAVMIFGLGRFLIILTKIFLLHFVSLVLLPFIFSSKNWSYLSNFTMKVLVTMLELPVFVIALWLAIKMNALMHALGDTVNKKLILGMLENNKIGSAVKEITLSDFTSMNFEYANVLKIYLLDGFMEISITAISIVIIYYLILKVHNAVFEMIEIQGLNQLDNAMDHLSESKYTGKI